MYYKQKSKNVISSQQESMLWFDAVGCSVIEMCCRVSRTFFASLEHHIIKGRLSGCLFSYHSCCRNFLARYNMGEHWSCVLLKNNEDSSITRDWRLRLKLLLCIFKEHKNFVKNKSNKQQIQDHSDEGNYVLFKFKQTLFFSCSRFVYQSWTHISLYPKQNIMLCRY